MRQVPSGDSLDPESFFWTYLEGVVNAILDSQAYVAGSTYPSEPLPPRLRNLFGSVIRQLLDFGLLARWRGSRPERISELQQMCRDKLGVSLEESIGKARKWVDAQGYKPTLWDRKFHRILRLSGLHPR
jgi:hypothetical protein